MSLILPHIPDNATNRQLELAAAHNHTGLFCRNAIARGGEVRTVDGLTYTYDGAGHQSMIAFPSLAGEAAEGALDEMMTWYASRPNRGLGCWSLDPSQPADLGAKLKARGFQDGWRPCWMALDLRQMDIGYEAPAQLQVVMDNHLDLHRVKDLPYTGRDGAIAAEVLRSEPERVQQFVAFLKGRIVGHSAVFLTTGAYGVAGIYNVAVIPAAREKGIGKALVMAACRQAKEKGYRYAVLNATGRKMYEQVGFRWVGDGFTWWLLPREAG